MFYLRKFQTKKRLKVTYFRERQIVLTQKIPIFSAVTVRDKYIHSVGFRQYSTNTSEEKRMIPKWELKGAVSEEKNDSKMGAGESSLGDELYEAVSRELVNEDSHLVSKVTGMLLEADKDTVREMLKSRSSLQSAIQRTIECLNSLETAEKDSGKPTTDNPVGDSLASVTAATDDEIGDLLYDKIVKEYPDHASKLTGMLLEMDHTRLQEILQSNGLFRAALEKAVSAIDERDHDNDVHLNAEEGDGIESVGDLLYEKVKQIYPAEAAKITGMLLEIDTDTLKGLLEDEKTFQEAVTKAAKVITT